MIDFRRLLLLAICYAILNPAGLGATGLEHNFEQGNSLYGEGDYAAAIVEYEKVVAARYESPELFYNLGNAYFREGHLGQAILNYSRAHRLDARDDDIRANLEFARQFTIDRFEVSEEAILLDYVNRFFDSFSLTEITWLTMILYFLTAAVILIRYIYRWYRVSMPLVAILAACFVVSAVFCTVKLDRDVWTRTGVVLAQQIEVKNGPGEDFNGQFTAHAGLVFNIEREESGYYLVNFENRLKGWILKSAAGEI